jgi:hypothetical protein
MNIQGKIHEIFETAKINDKFQKREFVIEYAENPMYPQYVLLQLVQDKCDYLDKFKKGQQVSVDVNIRGRAWTSPEGVTKYFNTLEAWRINLEQSQQPQQPAQPVASGLGDDDDLPF